MLRNRPDGRAADGFNRCRSSARHPAISDTSERTPRRPHLTSRRRLLTTAVGGAAGAAAATVLAACGEDSISADRAPTAAVTPTEQRAISICA